MLDDYVRDHTREAGQLDKAAAPLHADDGAEAAPRLAPLSAVPPVFFRQDFDLGHPYTFDLVTERYKQSTALGADDDADASQYGVVLNQMLQEKLSYYSDLIEQHLVHEIGARSASFFQALGTLEQLQQDTAQCLDKAGAVSAYLDQLGTYVHKGQSLAQWQDERRQLEAERELLLDVQQLLERRDLLLLSVQHGEYEHAARLLDDLRATWRASAPLSGLACLASLPAQLDDAEAAMASALQRMLAEHLQSSLEALPPAALDAPPEGTPLAELWADEPPAPDAAVLPPAVPSVVALLVRCRGVAPALEAHTASAAAALERAVRAALADRADVLALLHDAPPGELAYATYMPALIALLRALWHAAQHFDQVHRALAALLPEAQQPLLRPARHAAWAACERLLAGAVAPRHAACAAWPLEAFCVYFALLWRFVQRVEASAKQPSAALRSCVLSGGKTFLATYHRQRLERAMRAVEEETWTPTPVPAALQALVNELLEAGRTDVPSCMVPPVWSLAPPADAAPGGGESTRTVSVGDHAYFVVKASATVVTLLRDYVRLALNLPVFTAETLGALLEFLKQFNSRTCQVVLGAGAMRSAGLKNITARHLAIAAQTLSLMTALMPALRGVLQRRLQPTQLVLLGDFDKLLRDYREHQYEIHAKLLAIMSDRVQVHSQALTRLDAAAAAPTQPVQDLCRETATLHRVVKQLLPDDVVRWLFAKVTAEADTRLAQALLHTDMRPADVHQRWAADVEYLGDKMAALYPDGQLDKLRDALARKQPRATEPRRDAPTPVLGYQARRSLGSRPPASQSPRLEAMEAFHADGARAQRASSRSPEKKPLPHRPNGAAAEGAASDGRRDSTPTTDEAPQDQARKDQAQKAASPKDQPPKEQPRQDQPPKEASQKDQPPKDHSHKDQPPKDQPPKEASQKDQPPKDAPQADPATASEQPAPMPAAAAASPAAEDNDPPQPKSGTPPPPGTPAAEAPSSTEDAKSAALTSPPAPAPPPDAAAPLVPDAAAQTQPSPAAHAERGPEAPAGAAPGAPVADVPSATPMAPATAQALSAPAPAPSAAAPAPRAKPRMSLEQRLAEAAKRRGQQRAQAAGSPTKPVRAPDASSSSSGPSTASPTSSPTKSKLSLAERLASVTKAERVFTPPSPRHEPGMSVDAAPSPAARTPAEPLDAPAPPAKEAARAAPTASSEAAADSAADQEANKTDGAPVHADVATDKARAATDKADVGTDKAHGTSSTDAAAATPMAPAGEARSVEANAMPVPVSEAPAAASTLEAARTEPTPARENPGPVPAEPAEPAEPRTDTGGAPSLEGAAGRAPADEASAASTEKQAVAAPPAWEAAAPELAVHELAAAPTAEAAAAEPTPEAAAPASVEAHATPESATGAAAPESSEKAATPTPANDDTAPVPGTDAAAQEPTAPEKEAESGAATETRPETVATDISTMPSDETLAADGAPLSGPPAAEPVSHASVAAEMATSSPGTEAVAPPETTAIDVVPESLTAASEPASSEPAAPVVDPTADAATATDSPTVADSPTAADVAVVTDPTVADATADADAAAVADPATTADSATAADVATTADSATVANPATGADSAADTDAATAAADAGPSTTIDDVAVATASSPAAAATDLPEPAATPVGPADATATGAAALAPDAVPAAPNDTPAAAAAPKDAAHDKPASS